MSRHARFDPGPSARRNDYRNARGLEATLHGIHVRENGTTEKAARRVSGDLLRTALSNHDPEALSAHPPLPISSSRRFSAMRSILSMGRLVKIEIRLLSIR